MVTKIPFCGKSENINDFRSEFRADGKHRDLRWSPPTNLVKPQGYENYDLKQLKERTISKGYR